MYTCIALHHDDIQKLDRAASKSGRSRSSVIAGLLRKLANSQQATPSFRRIQYQARRKGIKWRMLHIQLNEADYELFLDMRKFMKKSVSFLISIAIKKHLFNCNVLKSVFKNINMDNYHNYIISYNKLNGAICWKIYWGMPYRKKLLKTPET